MLYKCDVIAVNPAQCVTEHTVKPTVKISHLTGEPIPVLEVYYVYQFFCYSNCQGLKSFFDSG